ncbi:unknown [[Mannheimia] succiniciproducens MBEL55E]|uniref:Uncharacterized protein n=1 Tax=Mannheimia succiniciproducens (strain KCTC 0769BP / MBEL55E) TaxID=221988 RepID=Q65QI9_MANSM|nr:unknown [[Mannheimia] succiniciproducens MBEL55E]
MNIVHNPFPLCVIISLSIRPFFIRLYYEFPNSLLDKNE